VKTFDFISSKKDVSSKLNMLASLFVVLSIVSLIGFYRFYTHSNANFDKMIEVHTMPLSNLVEIKDIYEITVLDTINQSAKFDYLTSADVREILLVANKLTRQLWRKHYGSDHLHDNYPDEIDNLIHKTENRLILTANLIDNFVKHNIPLSELRISIKESNELLTDLIAYEIESAQLQQTSIKQERSDLISIIIPVAFVLFSLLILIYWIISRSIKKINYDLASALSLFDNGKFVVFKWKNEEGWPVEFISNNVEEVIGIPREKFFQGDAVYSELIHSEHVKKVTQEVIENSKDGVNMFIHEPYQLKVFDDKYIWIYDATTIIRDSSGNITHYVGYIHGIDEQVKKELDLKNEKARLDFVAHHDELTSLPNRVLFMDRVEQAIKNHERENELFAVLFVDLDHFKEINDSFGHDVGDIVLQKSSARLSTVIRGADTVSRWGGDEFVIILEHIKHSEDIINICKKILEEFKENIMIDDHAFFISLSIGVSIYPNDGKSINALLKNADAAMYKAKDEGRNNYQFYAKEMTRLAFEKVALETQLRDAIKNRELIVYYQAQINLQNNELIGAEALVRWQHPSLGLVTPSKFISLAEETDLIIHLGSWILEATMKQIVIWHEAGLNPKKVSINLAGKQILQKNLVTHIKHLLSKTNCKAEWIELEVTEGFIMKNPELAIENLAKLRDMGIEIAIDDFGTGYSSLSYLKKLPITKLKIDQSFVRDIEVDEDDKAIVKSIIALSKGLNLLTIAEGVEKESQKEFLIQEGCDEMQGYLYSKPIPAKEYEKTILNR